MDQAEKGERYARMFRKAGVFLGKGNIARAVDILKEGEALARSLGDARDIVRHHHERYGGDGYPDNLAREAIPEIARAMCVVDSYDAMSFRRPYRQALSYPQARAELQSCTGTQFDPDMTAAFLRVLTRLSRRHTQAQAVAEEAAARVDAAKHALLRTAEDEARPEYKEIQAALRKVREENPSARFITTMAQAGKRFVLVVEVAVRRMHLQGVKYT
jgi:hypothetical protein